MFKTGNDLSLQQGTFHTLFSGIFSRKTACRSSASGMPKQKQRNREMRDFSRLIKNIPQQCALTFCSAELNIEQLKNILVFYGKRIFTNNGIEH